MDGGISRLLQPVAAISIAAVDQADYYLTHGELVKIKTVIDCVLITENACMYKTFAPVVCHFLREEAVVDYKSGTA